jgi:DMSO reductase anchor subunit
MNIVRNILAVIIGILACMLVNGGIVSLSASVIPPPEGMDVSNMDSIRANAHLFEPKHFIMPFLAHALGSVVGGLLAALVAGSRKMTFALVIGFVHLLGGITAAFMIPAPLWFVVLDLGVAYVPMAWIGGKLGGGSRTVPA